MHSKSELKELEQSVKKLDLNLFVWVIARTAIEFDNEIDGLRKNGSFNFVLKIIEDCETLIDVKRRALLLIFNLEISKKEKIDFLNKLCYEIPHSDLVRQLKIINSNKRLASFIYYNLNPDITIKHNLNKPTGLESLISHDFINIDLNELIVDQSSTYTYANHRNFSEKNTNQYVKENQNLEPIKNKSFNKEIFHKGELVYFYGNNTSLLVNLELIDRFLIGKDYTYSFNAFMRTFNEIQKKSRTAIDKNMENNSFSIWLYTYIEKNIINCEIVNNINYVPSNDEERINLMLHQLDIWFLLDESRYKETLRRIQLAWNKKKFDHRKREEKCKK